MNFIHVSSTILDKESAVKFLQRNLLPTKNVCSNRMTLDEAVKYELIQGCLAYLKVVTYGIGGSFAIVQSYNPKYIYIQLKLGIYNCLPN